MGRYDNNLYLTVETGNFSTLVDEPKVGTSRARMDGDYTQYEIRVNMVPYTESGDILLYKTLRKSKGGKNVRALEMPQRIVTIPKVDEDKPIDKDEFRRILFNNLYIAIMSDTEEIEDQGQFDEESVYSIIRRMGLGGQLSTTIFVDPDNDTMVRDHLIDVYVMIKIDYNKIESDFIYLATSMFEQYCDSKDPKSYAIVLGFYPEDYNEESSDFRMNPLGKAQICSVIRWMRRRKIIR